MKINIKDKLNRLQKSIKTWASKTKDTITQVASNIKKKPQESTPKHDEQGITLEELHKYLEKKEQTPSIENKSPKVEKIYPPKTIVVMGANKAGKSTFINYLIGSRCLPYSCGYDCTKSCVVLGPKNKNYYVTQDGMRHVIKEESLKTLAQDETITKIYIKHDLGPLKKIYPNFNIIDTPGLNYFSSPKLADRNHLINSERLNNIESFLLKKYVLPVFVLTLKELYSTGTYQIFDTITKVKNKEAFFIINKYEDEMESVNREKINTQLKLFAEKCGLKRYDWCFYAKYLDKNYKLDSDLVINRCKASLSPCQYFLILSQNNLIISGGFNPRFIMLTMG